MALDLISAPLGQTQPFIAPRFLKKRRHSLQDQVLSELEERGFPRPAAIEVESQDALVGSGFLKLVRIPASRSRDVTLRARGVSTTGLESLA